MHCATDPQIHTTQKNAHSKVQGSVSTAEYLLTHSTIQPIAAGTHVAGKQTPDEKADACL